MARDIALFGPTGAGKSAIADYLVSKYSYQRCHPGKLCREVALKLFQKDDKTTLNKINDAMRSIDPNVWLSAALDACLPSIPIVVDGMRFKSNYVLLKDRGFLMWKIDASVESRKNRLLVRGQEFDWTSDAHHPGEKELANETFDVTIDNNMADKEALFAAVDHAFLA